MKRYVPIIVVFGILLATGLYVVNKKNQAIHRQQKITIHERYIGEFNRQHKCSKPPQFLSRMNIPQPVMIDLSQKRFKGIALLYGKNFKKVLHPKQWEQYEHFGTYTMDEKGNIYLIPTPFISIRPTTFNLQKNIYKLNSKTGKLSIFMHFEKIVPSATNPYGLNAITYDCDSHTLWAAAIDKSDYSSQKGVIYHIDPRNKKILQEIKGVDVLSMVLVKTSRGKFLLIGSARDNGLYAYPVIEDRLALKPIKLLTLSDPNEHIRKIKISGKNKFELQSIPFAYALIAQSDRTDRIYYRANWNKEKEQWEIEKI